MPISSQPSLDAYHQALSMGDHRQALEALMQQADGHPGNPTLHWLIASEYAELGQFDAAEASFINTLNLGPNLHVARFQLGLLQYSSGRPTTAMQTWAALEQLDEGHYLVSFKRGFAALAIDAFEDAILLFSRGIAANQENAPLNRDIQLMISEINMRGQGAGKNEKAGTQEDASFDHLVASYRRNLKH